jgi:hypothetical protein
LYVKVTVLVPNPSSFSVIAAAEKMEGYGMNGEIGVRQFLERFRETLD